MTLKQQVVAAAARCLEESPDGLTEEVLAREVGRQVGRQMPQLQVIGELRKLPQRFLQGPDGKWRLRPVDDGLDVFDQQNVETSRDDESVEAQAAVERLPFRAGCYVVFDLEATGQSVDDGQTEIIQIAAQRWLDGAPQEPWATFVRPGDGIVPAHIAELTKITTTHVAQAPRIGEALRAFLDYVGDLPVIAHNGAGYDGPLIAATAKRVNVSLPDTWEVLDTLPLARVLHPLLQNHRVGTLAEHYGCARPDAHRADADVEMLGGVIRGLQSEIASSVTGAAVFGLLKRCDDRWAEILLPPASIPTTVEVVAQFGAALTPLLGARTPEGEPDDVDSAFARAEDYGRSRRPAQIQMANLTSDVLRDGGYAAVEAGTGTGKSLGYLVPAALAAAATGQRVAVSTFTRILQSQLYQHELPFVRTLFPSLRFALLQGRANYISAALLAEEVDDAWSEPRISPARAWILVALIRFAESTQHGNLEELGYVPQGLDEYLRANGAAISILNSVRAIHEDGKPSAGIPDFYRRARANADSADIVVVNHALFLNSLLQSNGADDEPVAPRVICDEAHTLEDAATLALEDRFEEDRLRRLLNELHHPRARTGLVHGYRSSLGLPSDDPVVQRVRQGVLNLVPALDSLSQRIELFVADRTVVSKSERERYGVRVRIDAGAMQAAGGPALRTAEESVEQALAELIVAVGDLTTAIKAATEAGAQPRSPVRVRRLLRQSRSAEKDLKQYADVLRRFWMFRNARQFVQIVELGRTEERGDGHRWSPFSLVAVPVNVGPVLWDRVWSRLDAAVVTSATLTVFGQGFRFFRQRIGWEDERVQRSAPDKTVTTLELPHVFDYHEHALFEMPNDLPAPRDTELKRNFPEAVSRLLERFIPFFQGRTLVLFTSNQRRDMVYDKIAAPMSELGFPIACQGQGSLQRLIDEFRDDPARSLLGSRSLWEGVNVPGESLSYVFLEKLPYPSLGDPVESARMTAVEAGGGDPFYQYLLPKMVMILKQGFGRLIRSGEDRGAVVLLDKRLRSAMYRREVLGSLPDPTIGYDSDAELFRRIADWMSLPFDPTDLPEPTVADVARIIAENQLTGPYVASGDYERVARPKLVAVQKALWGQTSFRSGQEEIIRAVLDGKDHLTLLPTGAGKSRTYQLPALIRPGLTLVVSPLIALIRDQVEKMREIPGLDCVHALVSGVDAATQEEILQSAVSGKIKLLYVSPERLRDPRFRSYIDRLPLVQLVVDEAHCISTWGHDFRPDFLDVANLLPQGANNSRLPVHALTATATRQVQDEIKTSLQMGDARGFERYSGDFVRDNLVYRVYPVSRAAERDPMTVGIVHQLVRDKDRGGAGIVYVTTRKESIRLARLLRDQNVAAQAYHGGMATPERHQVQERFMQDELDVVVATSAFGMGVDKSNIRFVLHYDHPASLEAYAQEAGRAGRDGREAYAILLYSAATQRTTRFIAKKSLPTSDALEQFRQALLSTAEGTSAIRMPDGSVLIDPDDLATMAGVDDTQARVLFYSFQEAGLIERGPDSTLEARIMLTRPISEALLSVSDSHDHAIAAQVLAQIGAEVDQLASYQAADFVRDTGVAPSHVDRILNRMAEAGVLLYRPYQRGATLRMTSQLPERDRIGLVERRFAARFQRFEERLQSMLAYAKLPPGHNRCRSSFLVDYITGETSGARCGKCDLCSPASEHLPWDPAVRMYGAPLAVDVRLAVLVAVRDHNGLFSKGTVVKMLLGIPQTSKDGRTFPLAKTARVSDHFGELAATPADSATIARTIDLLLSGGYLSLVQRAFSGSQPYEAITITALGRDALAGGTDLPELTAP